MSSLTDILTALKNGVVAVNGVSSAINTATNNTGTPILLYRGAAPTGSFATLYAGSNANAIYVTDIVLCNSDPANAVTAFLCLVPSGGAANAGNALYYNTSIPAASTVHWFGSQVLPVNAIIQGYASSAVLGISITGNIA